MIRIVEKLGDSNELLNRTRGQLLFRYLKGLPEMEEDARFETKVHHNGKISGFCRI